MNFFLAKLAFRVMARDILYLFFIFWHGIDLNIEKNNCFMGNIIIIRAVWKIFTSPVKLFLLDISFFAQGIYVNLTTHKNSFSVRTTFYILYSKIIIYFSPGRNIVSFMWTKEKIDEYKELSQLIHIWL